MKRRYHLHYSEGRSSLLLWACCYSFRVNQLDISWPQSLTNAIAATNISMLTTAQSDIAEDFDAFSETTWFSSAYLIAMSSVSPLAGRLCQIFTARNYTLFSVGILSVGLFVTAASQSLPVFLFGRALSGCGSAGVMVTSFIFILDLASKRRRGLFIGLLNVGVTTGISCGALLAGLLTPVFGWVCHLPLRSSETIRS